MTFVLIMELRILQPNNLQTIKNLSDLELIQQIGSVDTVFSESCFNEFYNRYKNYLLSVCRKSCFHFDSSDSLADDIFQNTFLKVLKKSSTFKIKNPDENTNISGKIKSWLSIIAKNELIDFLRKNPDEKVLSDRSRIKSYDLEETFIKEDHFDVEENIEPVSIQKVILDNALNTLTLREKYVLMTYMQFFNPLEINRHLPDEALKNICDKFNIKASNVRQIKSRALKKLKTEIDKSS